MIFLMEFTIDIQNIQAVFFLLRIKGIALFFGTKAKTSLAFYVYNGKKKNLTYSSMPYCN